ncbi:conserved hypothetical protein [Neospora caninum Liverpool]|uniref:Uncharacterized protein n=1 Tax=Neospora caninum (strain Liverpool) TaxID=572307 RepID=F0VN45_NEOCL|nr:conserved hypothetical protein [Neospora caninum Liverpool]CBZ55141.1 conserved hypothetical protein [Neospora caninum Liverpool]CEL69867.1 TPA: hypothetical protein BN1204_055660 [Neospora caninum Liverpool]|eukprot:XP_003885169.1 conserved hypothetical protein [Neospora caninum Liverpool]
MSSQPQRNKLRALQVAAEGRRKSSKGQGELLRVLRQQRVFVDERAIHFVSEGRQGPRADARNSVFKLQTSFAEKSETDQEQSLRKKFSVMHKENDESGDEGWGNQYATVPEALKTERGKSILAEQNRDELLDAIENIEAEAEQLPEDTVTREEIDEKAALNQTIQRYSVAAPDALSPQQLEALAKIAESSHTEMTAEEDEDEANDEDSADDDDDDEDFTSQDLHKLNDMQREFLGNNMIQWMNSMEAGYRHGMILVKINCLGVAFIRNVIIKDCLLIIAQPNNWLHTAINPRKVALTSVESVSLGRNSREFQAMEKRIQDGTLDEKLPSPKFCAVVHLPSYRTLSLVFVDEEHRNGFVFFLRIMMQKAKEAEKKASR